MLPRRAPRVWRMTTAERCGQVVLYSRRDDTERTDGRHVRAHEKDEFQPSNRLPGGVRFPHEPGPASFKTRDGRFVDADTKRRFKFVQDGVRSTVASDPQRGTGGRGGAILMRAGDVWQWDSDCVLLPFFSGKELALDAPFAEDIVGAVLGDVGSTFKGSAGECQLLPTGQSPVCRAPTVLLLGLGARKDYTEELSTQCVRDAIRLLGRKKVQTVATGLFGESALGLGPAARSIAKGFFAGIGHGGMRDDMVARFVFVDHIPHRALKIMNIGELATGEYSELWRAFDEVPAPREDDPDIAESWFAATSERPLRTDQYPYLAKAENILKDAKVGHRPTFRSQLQREEAFDDEYTEEYTMEDTVEEDTVKEEAVEEVADTPASVRKSRIGFVPFS